MLTPTYLEYLGNAVDDSETPVLDRRSAALSRRSPGPKVVERAIDGALDVCALGVVLPGNGASHTTTGSAVSVHPLLVRLEIVVKLGLYSMHTIDIQT